jgi:hypothetical protein
MQGYAESRTVTSTGSRSGGLSRADGELIPLDGSASPPDRTRWSALDPRASRRCPARPHGRPSMTGLLGPGAPPPGRAGPVGRRRRTRAAVVHDGGRSTEQCLLVGVADGEGVVRGSSIRARSAQPRATSARRPCARIASMAPRALSFETRMLPRPTSPVVCRRPGTPPARPGVGVRPAGSTRRSARRQDPPAPATGSGSDPPPATGDW